MDIKRVLTGVLGLPIIVALCILGNKYIIDILIAVVALISINEFTSCTKKKLNPISWIGYLMAICIAFIHVIPMECIRNYLGLGIVTLLVILFIHVIITEMKTNIVDISVTLLGIIYIIGFTVFFALLYGLEIEGKEIGKLYIWYIFAATWGTDIFAYLIGKNFGKHKFSKISPNKSIEGCIGGTIGGILLVVGYTFILNQYFDMNINYLIISIIGLILSIIGQIGDFSASSIKRYSEIKDFSNLIPGHGGMLDRIDSVIFAAPFAYYLLTIFI